MSSQPKYFRLGELIFQRKSSVNVSVSVVSEVAKNGADETTDTDRFVFEIVRIPLSGSVTLFKFSVSRFVSGRY